MSDAALPRHEDRGRDTLHLRTRELELFRDPPMVRLSSSDDGSQGEIVSCSDGPIVVGRSPSADLHVTDQWVSRRQCAVQRVGDKFIIRDLESRHGTYVNEEKVAQTKLRNGDVIRIGLVLLEVCVRR